MGKRFPEINPKTGQRVKELCIDLGITQKELADKIHLSEKTVSSMVRGHSGVTRPTAEAIVCCFPEYRIEWLLGIDDVKTKYDMQLLDKADKEYEVHYNTRKENFNFKNVIEAINLLAVECRIEITACEDGGLILESDFGPYRANELYKPIKLTSEAANWLTFDITEYVRTTLISLLINGNRLAAINDEKAISFAPSRYESLKGGREHVPEEQ